MGGAHRRPDSALAIYRRVLAPEECDVLHLRESELPLVPRQAEFAQRLNKLDFWGKVLTVGALFLIRFGARVPTRSEHAC